jgi:hypothetical protein
MVAAPLAAVVAVLGGGSRSRSFAAIVDDPADHLVELVVGDPAGAFR